MGNRRKGLSPEDRAFLLRQRRDRGIVASGWFTSPDVFQQPHWRLPNRQANYATLEWDQWLPVDDRLTVEELERHNCHAMLHQRRPALSIAVLQAQLRN